MISLEKCDQKYNAINHLPTKIYVDSKTKVVKIKIFNMIPRTNEAKILVKRTSCYCKYQFNSSTRNYNQEWNND